jgi:hypothetical protein
MSVNRLKQKCLAPFLECEESHPNYKMAHYKRDAEQAVCARKVSLRHCLVGGGYAVLAAVAPLGADQRSYGWCQPQQGCRAARIEQLQAAGQLSDEPLE